LGKPVKPYCTGGCSVSLFRVNITFVFVIFRGMAYVLLILISIAGLALCGFYLKKNIIRIKDKNKDEPKKYKRIWNYVPTGLWYGYLILFFAGLTINNLIF
jgi:hypothetical protein